MGAWPDEPSLADIQRQHPTWRCWRGISGLYYARPADTQPGQHAHLTGEDPRDLHDQITRAETHHHQK